VAASKPAHSTIDAYIAAFPEDVQAALQSVRATIREVVPDATEAIKYQMPTFVLNGNLVLFSAWKNHIALDPATAEMEAAMPDLAGRTSGKGTIRFPLNEPMPLDLIRRIVEFRVQESQAGKIGG
jgi:uncharacterized protein YdhG (YjbR/CyaY superfamily)